MTIRVITDSAANLPADVATSNDIDIVPMYLKFGDDVLLDGVDLPPGDFYERLAAAETPVSTAGASVGDFRTAFERALAEADHVVYVSVASFVSVTHTSATVAAREVGTDRVWVVDSASASMGEGFVALEAARAAAGGATAAEVVARAKEIASRTQVVATIDTFDYLRRSGRVHALLAYAGSALNIKPVFAFRGGKVEQLGRPRSRARAVERVVDEVRAAANGALHLAVCHAGVPNEAAALLARLCEEFRPVESHLTEFTPLMGAHTGPGLLGAAFWS